MFELSPFLAFFFFFLFTGRKLFSLKTLLFSLTKNEIWQEEKKNRLPGRTIPEPLSLLGVRRKQNSCCNEVISSSCLTSENCLSYHKKNAPWQESLSEKRQKFLAINFLKMVGLFLKCTWADFLPLRVKVLEYSIQVSHFLLSFCIIWVRLSLRSYL